MIQKLRASCSAGDRPVFWQSTPLFRNHPALPFLPHSSSPYQPPLRPFLHRNYLAVMSAACGFLIPACSPLGPDFTRPKVSWLDAWAARPLEQPTPQLTGPANVSTEQWWRNFNDPVMEQLVAEAQRLNPGVRTAAARILAHPLSTFRTRDNNVFARSALWGQQLRTRNHRVSFVSGRDGGAWRNRSHGRHGKNSIP